MPFKKGSKKPVKSGRKKGQKNHTTVQVRNMISEGLMGEGSRPFEELQKLEGKEYIESFERLMKYILPTLKAVEISGDENKPPPPFQFIIQRQEDDITD